MIYIKRLTKSDLTLIRQFVSEGRQMAIILGKNYISNLGKSWLDMEFGDTKKLDIVFFGPDGKMGINKKNASIGKYKEWRIQECVLDAPSNDPDRFSILKPGDLFFFSIIGHGEKLSSIGVFVSSDSENDKCIFKEFSRYKNRVLSISEAKKILNTSKIEGVHPISFVISQEKLKINTAEINLDFNTITDSELTDSLVSGFLGAVGKVKKISKEKLDKKLFESNRIGSDGEKKLHEWLYKKPIIGEKRVVKHRWVAKEYATAPYDFELEFEDKTKLLLELKTTSGPFRNNIYLSFNELIEMDKLESKVILARLYDLDVAAKLRFAYEVRPKVGLILSALSCSTNQFGLASVWASPDFFDFSDDVISLE